jgi:hypothetical protein
MLAGTSRSCRSQRRRVLAGQKIGDDGLKVGRLVIGLAPDRAEAAKVSFTR